MATKAIILPTAQSPAHAANEGTPLILGENLSSYFAQEVTAALQETNVKISAEAEFYVVSVLSHFALNQELLRNLMEQPLAVIYCQARNAEPGKQVELYRRLGDGALCLTGLFAESLTHSMVDFQYYTTLGGNAYNSLSAIFTSRSGGQNFAILYDELSDNFLDLVEVLNAISERVCANESQATASGLLRLYERWARTKSQRLQRALQEQGVFPAREGPKRPQ